MPELEPAAIIGICPDLSVPLTALDALALGVNVIATIATRPYCANVAELIGYALACALVCSMMFAAVLSVVTAVLAVNGFGCSAMPDKFASSAADFAAT